MSNDTGGRAVIELGYVKVVLPMSEAVEVFKHLRDVEFLESEYKDKTMNHYFVDKLENAPTLRIFTDEQYAKAKLYTERKNNEHAS